MTFKKTDLKLLFDNDPDLFIRPEPWDFDVDGDGEMFANLLIDKMVELKGIGLSANQVSIPRRVFVIGMNEYRKAFFNPEIIKVSNNEVANEEGCLSFPGIFLMVKRPKDITIRYQNEKGEWVEEDYIGLSSKVIQHEYDHMEGKIFKSRVSDLKWNMALKKKSKKIKRIINEHVKKQLIDIHKKMEQKNNVDNSTRVS